MLYLSKDPDRAKGQDCHSGSEEQPTELHDAQKLTEIGEELATEKSAINRVREGENDGLAMDANFLPEGYFMMSIPVSTFCASV